MSKYRLSLALISVTLPWLFSTQAWAAGDLCSDKDSGDSELLSAGPAIPDGVFAPSIKMIREQLFVYRAGGAPALAGAARAPADASQATMAVAPPATVETPSAKQTAATADPTTAASKLAIAAPTYSSDAVSSFDCRLNDLVHAAEQQSADLQKYIKAVDYYKSWKNRLVESSTDMLNYSCLFKGVSPSSEAGDIILSEKTKLKGLAAAKYLRQKLGDDVQLKLVSAVLQLAATIGNPDSGSGNGELAEASAQLDKLVGPLETAKTIDFLKSENTKKTSDALPPVKALWSVDQSKRRLEATVNASMCIDPILSEVVADVHHFNQHSTAALAAHRVARVALNAGTLSPNLVGPVAQVILFGYLAVTGGTEQEKLLKELYIDKRFSSRMNLLSEQAHLALFNYQLGLLTGNQLLRSCAQRLITSMAGSQAATAVLINPGPDAVDTPRQEAQSGIGQ